MYFEQETNEPFLGSLNYYNFHHSIHWWFGFLYVLIWVYHYSFSFSLFSMSSSFSSLTSTHIPDLMFPLHHFYILCWWFDVFLFPLYCMHICIGNLLVHDSWDLLHILHFMHENIIFFFFIIGFLSLVFIHLFTLLP